MIFAIFFKYNKTLTDFQMSVKTLKYTKEEFAWHQGNLPFCPYNEIYTPKYGPKALHVKLVQGQRLEDGTFEEDSAWDMSWFAKIEQLRSHSDYHTRVENQTFTMPCPIMFGNFVVKNKNIKGRPFKVSSDVYKVNDSCNYGDHARLRLKNVEIYNIFQAELFKILVDHIDFGIVASLLYTNCNKTLNAKSILGFSICDHDFSDEIPYTHVCKWLTGYVKLHHDKMRDPDTIKSYRTAPAGFRTARFPIRVATHAATPVATHAAPPVPRVRHPKYVGECPYDLFGLTKWDYRNNAPFYTSKWYADHVNDINEEDIRVDVAYTRNILWMWYNKALAESDRNPDFGPNDFPAFILKYSGLEMPLPDILRWIATIKKLPRDYVSYRMNPEDVLIPSDPLQVLADAAIE